MPLDDDSFKRDVLERGHLECDISDSGGEIAVVVAATIPLTLLITLIPVSLFASASNSSLSVSSALPRMTSLRSLLITASFSCTIFSDMVCCLLSNACVATSFYQRSANHVFLFLPTLFYLIVWTTPHPYF